MSFIRPGRAAAVSTGGGGGSSSTPFLNVRTGLRYATLQALADAGGSPGSAAGIANNDVIKVTAGTYTITTAGSIGSPLFQTGSGHVGIPVANLTVEWETFGSPAIFDMSSWAATDQGSGGDGDCFVMNNAGRIWTVRGLHFKGARVGGLGRGINVKVGSTVSPESQPTASITVEYCKFYQCGNGIMTSPNYNFTVTCKYSTFEDNGKDGLSHGVYLAHNLRADFIGCTWRTTASGTPQASVGHLLKCRAKTTNVLGCLFDPQVFSSYAAGGCATICDFSNGGVVTFAGNTVFRYGAANRSDDNATFKYGEEQTPFYNANSPSYGNDTDNFAHDGRTHTLLIAQNTMRLLQPEGGTAFELVNFGSGITNEDDSPGTYTATVRNNIIGSDSASSPNIASKAVTDWPDNTAVAHTTITVNSGVYSGGLVTGSPAVNDAVYAYNAEFGIPLGRSDNFRGGRVSLASWVPSTAWQWTDITGTKFSDVMLEDGTGIAPSSNADSFNDFHYYQIWGGYVGMTYSAKNHEFYLIGGGHSQTSLNCLVRWNLGQDSPNLSMVNQTSQATRISEYATTTGYYSDGKPVAPHTYNTVEFVDAIDELVMVGMGFWNQNADSIAKTAGWPRNGSWRSDGYWPNPPDVPLQHPVFQSSDGAFIYFTEGGSNQLVKLNTSTQSQSNIGSGGVVDCTNRRAAHGGGNVALMLAAELDRGSAGKLVMNLTTGVTATATFSGDSVPSDGCRDLIYIPSKGYYIAMFIPASEIQPATPTGGSMSSCSIYKITATSDTTYTAQLMTVTGTAPDKNHLQSGLGWDESFQCLVVATAYDRLFKAIKVT